MRQSSLSAIIRVSTLRGLCLGLPCLLSMLSANAAAGADALPLTRERVTELVQLSPAARVAQFEAAVLGAGVEAAGVPSLDNPVLSGMGGVRFNPDGSRPLSIQANLSWPIDLGGQRGARTFAAKAEHRAALASAESGKQMLLLGALLQHQQVLRDEREVAIAEARHALSERFFAAAQRRQAAGGVPELDVALAAMQEKQDASAKAAAQGARVADELVLQALLGLEDVPVVQDALVPEGEPALLADSLQKIEERVDVRVASAELARARAVSARARAARWPTLSVLGQYERDDGANIGMLGFSMPLPLVNANAAEVAASAAEVDAAQAKVARGTTAAKGQVRELYARYASTKAAMDSLAPTEALATRAVSLATRGYELGENDLPSVLLVRREAIAVQAALLSAQHEHSTVKLELLVMTGRDPR